MLYLATKVPSGYCWLSRGDGKLNEFIFRQVCKKIVEGFTEDKKEKGPWGRGDDSKIDDFVVLGTTMDRAQKLILGEDKEMAHFLMDSFSY